VVAASSLIGAVPSSQSSGRTQSAEIARTILLSDLCVPMLAAAAAPVLMHPPGPTVLLTPGAVPPVPILARPPCLTLLDSMAVRVKCSSHLSPHLDHPLPSDYSAHSSVYLVLPRCHHTSRPTFHAKHEHAQHPVVYLDPSCTICRPIFQLYRLNHNAQTIALATAPLSHSVPTYLRSSCSRNVFTHYSLLIVIPGQLQSCICGYLKPDNPNRH